MKSLTLKTYEKLSDYYSVKTISDMSDFAEAILSLYPKKQLNKAIEEFAELIRAIAIYQIVPSKDLKLLTELYDAHIMLLQVFRIILADNELRRTYMNFAAGRTIDKMFEWGILKE